MATSQTVQIPAGARFIDCASKLTPSVVRAALAAGVTGFMKYTRYDNVDRPKYWTGEEIATVLELGGYVMSNWEIQADRATTAADPYAVGLSDGKRNRSWLRSIGYPDDVAAPVSVDQNTLASNFWAVHEFCRGHWDGDGDLCENIGYLDTDGGRALADLNPRIWIPGAFAWSPELYALSIALQRQGASQEERYRQLVELASRNEQAVAIQFPSEAAYGIRVDHNVVLKPFNVWCAPYTVADHTDDLKPAPQPEDDDMPQIVTNSETYTFAGEARAPGTVKWMLRDDGTKVHCTEGYWVGIGQPAGTDLTNRLIDSIPDYTTVLAEPGELLTAPAVPDLTDVVGTITFKPA